MAGAAPPHVGTPGAYPCKGNSARVQLAVEEISKQVNSVNW